MPITQAAFEQAQEAEHDNWARDAGNVSRILHELTEHADIAGPLRRILSGRVLERSLEVGIGPYGLGLINCHLSTLVSRIDAVDPLPRLALDVPDRALADYLQEIRGRTAYHVGVGEELPFAAASFDLVSCINVVDHAKHPEAILREVARVLKPGAIFAFGVNTLSTLGEWKWRIGRRRHPRSFIYVAHPHTYQWAAADAMIREVMDGRVLWNNRPSPCASYAGHGRMSFWIVEQAAVSGEATAES